MRNCAAELVGRIYGDLAENWKAIAKTDKTISGQMTDLD